MNVSIALHLKKFVLKMILFALYIRPTFKIKQEWFKRNIYFTPIFFFNDCPNYLDCIQYILVRIIGVSQCMKVYQKNTHKVCAMCKVVRLWQLYGHTLMILLLLLIIHKYLLTTMYVVWNTALFYLVYWCLVTVCGIEALPHEELILLT